MKYNLINRTDAQSICALARERGFFAESHPHPHYGEVEAVILSADCCKKYFVLDMINDFAKPDLFINATEDALPDLHRWGSKNRVRVLSCYRNGEFLNYKNVFLMNGVEPGEHSGFAAMVASELDLHRTFSPAVVVPERVVQSRDLAVLVRPLHDERACLYGHGYISLSNRSL